MLNEIIKGMDNAAELINENFEELGYEVGENENGSYLKHPSGWMVCYVRRLGDKEYTTTDASGSLYRASVDNWFFPEEFIAPPVVLEMMDRTGGMQGWVSRGGAVSSASISGTFLLSTHTNTKGYYSGFAIGRWK